MPLVPEWPDVAVRLAATVLAGALIGLDRDEHGRPPFLSDLVNRPGVLAVEWRLSAGRFDQSPAAPGTGGRDAGLVPSG